MKLTTIITCLLFSLTLIGQTATRNDNSTETKKIQELLHIWHQAAANANFDTYFGYMTEDAIFIGTDATEHWDMNAFKAFSKPYFDKGKAWSFTAIERNVFRQESSIGTFAWFDELLNTQMGICRGSGVVEKTKTGWKVKHYVLSIAIPNENVSDVTSLKKDFDTALITKLINN